MFGNVHRYMEAKHGPESKLPEIKVTEAESIQAMMASGKTHAEAKLQATVAKGLGSSVVVGNRRLAIREQP